MKLIILFCFYVACQLIFVSNVNAKKSKKDRLHKLRKLITNTNESVFSGRTLDVNGLGEINIKPDICTLSVSIESKDKKSASSAHSLTHQATKQLFNKLTENGIEMKDVATKNIILNPIYNYVQSKSNEYIKSIQVFEGFLSRQDIEIKIKDLTAVGAILDHVANLEKIQINNVGYSVESTKPYLDEVRENAINNAKAKAEQICKLTGMQLGKPISINEQFNSGYPTPVRHHHMEMMSMKSVAMDAGGGGGGVSQGEIKLTHSVSIQYELLLP